MVLQRPKSFPSATICKRPDLHLVSSSLAFRKSSSTLARQHMVLNGVMSIPKGRILLRDLFIFTRAGSRYLSASCRRSTGVTIGLDGAGPFIACGVAAGDVWRRSRRASQAVGPAQNRDHLRDRRQIISAQDRAHGL